MTVVFDGTRVSAAETITDGGVWDKWNASQNPSVEPDFFYQGAASISNKVGVTAGGVEMDASTGTHDMVNQIWLAKVNATNYQSLNVLGVDGMILYIGSANTDDQYSYHVHGKDTYPIAGGWVFIPIDPNVAGYRDATQGTPDLVNVNYWGVSCDFTATSKSENVMMDAIDFFATGTGLTMSGASQTFADFVTEDEGTVGNRWGIVRTIEGVIYVLGVLTIGTSTATGFTDTAKTLVFPDARCSVGWCGIDFGMAHFSSNIALTDCTFIGRGDAGGTADTRPDYEISGPLGIINIIGGSFQVFRRWTMAAPTVAAFKNVIFADGLLIIHVTGVAVTGCTFQGGTHGTNVAYITSDDLEEFVNCKFVFSSAGHAIRITATGTYTFDGNQFTGAWGADTSSDAMIFNDSGGLVTIDVGNGGTTVTFRNGSGASTVVNNNVNIQFTIQDTDGVGIVGAQVAVFRVDDDTELMNEDSAGGGRASQSFNFTADVDIYFRVRHSSSGTKYISASGVGIIRNTGFATTVTLFVDPNVDL